MFNVETYKNIYIYFITAMGYYADEISKVKVNIGW